MSSLVQDVRYGIRVLMSKPGFTAAAVLVLSLGIGANTAVFSLVNAFLLKPLRIPAPEQLEGCYSRDTRKPDTYRAFSYPNYEDLRQKNTVFSGMMDHDLALAGIAEGDTTRRAFVDVVSSDYFATMGVSLLRGRVFTAGEERPGSGVPVAIASYSFWNRTGRDANLLGRTLRVNGRQFTVVGIAPEGFTGTTALISPELYLPLGMFEALRNGFEGKVRPLAARDNHVLIVVGRLKPGVTHKAANAQLATVASQMAQAYPAENRDQSLLVSPLSRMSVSTNPGNDRGLAVPAALLLAMAGVVLLIASLNVANMMLARGTARRKEIAIRLALGAGRGNVLRQLFTEGLLLAVLGASAGLGVAYWSTTVLVRSMSRLAPIDLVYNAGPDLRVLAATAAFCVFSTLLFGLGPAWSLSRPSVLPALKAGESDAAAGGSRRLWSRRNLLVMSQIALSLVLLTAAGLFLRSSIQAARIEPGFRLAGGVVIEVDPSLAGYDEARGRQIFQALLDRLRGVPGVESASLAATVPFGIVSLGRNVERPSGDPAAVGCRFNIVGAEYFRTLGIPLLRGRFFEKSETGDGKTAAVAILDQPAASRLWPKGDAVGQIIRMVADGATKSARDVEVVGVVAATQDNIFGRDREPHVYVPFGQEFEPDMNIHLKVAAVGAPAEARLLDTVRREMRAVDDRLPVLALKTLRQHLDDSFDIWLARTAARLFAIFGGVALLLAAIGLYGVRAYTVARRTREIGIRMAVGASARDTLRLILREGAMVTAAGVGVGLALSLAAGKILGGLLYEVSGVDPLVLATAAALLAVVSLLACYLPARRAARVDPLVALRHE